MLIKSGLKSNYFWERVGAGVLDAMLMWVLLNFLGNLLGEGPEHVFIGVVYSIRGFLLALVVSWLYFAIQDSSKYQATFGKRVFKFVIENDNHTKMTFLKASGRFVIKHLSNLLVFLGFFMLIWDKDHKTFYDKICRTQVVKITN